MNRVFRIVWSTALHAWVVVSELTGKHGKGRGRSAATTTDQRPASRHVSIGSPLRLGILVAMTMLYAPVALSSTDLYWDVNGGSAGSGGTGTWNTSLPFWNSASDGVAGPFVNWNNSALNNAWFAGTAGTVTLGTPITVQNLNFTVTGYTLTGSTLTLAGTTPTISVTTGTSTINSVIAGSEGFTKTGIGTISLGGANTFTGNINLAVGSLILASDAALGAASNGITMAGGTGLTASSTLASTRVITLTGDGTASSVVALHGASAGAAQFTGTGGVEIFGGATMSNATSNYTGITEFVGGGTYGLTSIADVGVASAIGAPIAANEQIIVQAGGGLGGTLNYTGSGDTSNRDWQFQATSSGGNVLVNNGTGTLILTGNIAAVNQWQEGMNFQAQTADIELLGVLSSGTGTPVRPFTYTGLVGRTITLGGANTYIGGSTISGITVDASVLADTGDNSSFGTGTAGGITFVNGVLSYDGGAASSDRPWTVQGTGTLDNNGTGALTLSGATSYVAGGTPILILGGSYTGANTFSGVISGTGGVTMNGAGTWILGGANTYTGATTVQSGTLTAGTAQAFSASNSLVVNGGTLDLNNQDITAPSLAGTGGTVNLGSGTLTLNATSGSTTYAGSITGTGGLTKLGAATSALTGANTYTGATTIGGGTLTLNFAAAGAPASNIISGASQLALNGGTLAITGAAAANGQSFSGLDVNAGSNHINATAGSGATLTVGLGAINRSGGLIDFDFNTGATITTTNADGVLGGWATVNGSDYAQVSGGVIGAFTNYVDQDDASQWLSGQIISDAGGNPNTPYFNTVTGNVALGGLKYSAAANSAVTIGTGNVLGVDGSIIVAPTVTGAQTIQGGSLTGGAAGSPLGILQNSTGTFTIASTIVDNGGATPFTVGGSGTGKVVLTGANTYTGATTVSGSTLTFNSVADGGTASAIGASTADPSNLVLENGTLDYNGATASTDRGLTLVNGGPTRNIEVDNAADLTFSGQVTSPDNAGFTKTGTGTLSLTNAGNDFIGPVTVSAGVLSVSELADGGQASSLGASTSDSSNLVLQTGGTLQYTGTTVSTDRGFTLGSGSGHIDVAQAATTLTVSGTVVNPAGVSAGLFKDGDGTLVLSGTNTYAGGTTVDAGTLRAGSALAFGGNAQGTGDGLMTVQSGATLDLNNFSVWVAGLNGAGNVTLGSGTLQINGNGTFSGAISGTGGVTISGHTQAMTGCGNSFTGPFVLVSSVFSTDCLANGGQVSVHPATLPPTCNCRAARLPTPVPV